MAPLRILQLVGSPTNDLYCDLSELYARGSLAALADPARYDFRIAHVSPDGSWRFPASLDAAAIAAAPALALSEAVAAIAALDAHAAIPQMFCLAGMTDMRALLDVLAIPYLGNAPLQMAIAADKAMTRAIVAAAGVDVPEGRLVRRRERPAVALPVVVKPNGADNSEGVAFVEREADLGPAIEAAFAFSGAVLVEAYVPLGREVRCGVVARGDELVCLPLEEYYVHAEERPIRRQIDKLRREGDGALSLAAKTRTESWIVPDGDPIVEDVHVAARRCYEALGCRHYGLFDFRIDPSGRPWFLEAGLYCSFAPSSVVVTMMEAAGTPLARFFAEALDDLPIPTRLVPSPAS